MKCFIFLLYSSLLFIGNFAPSAASPAAAPAAEPGRTAGKQKGTPTTGQNTNRGQKRLGDDDGAGPSKTQKQARAPRAKQTPKVYTCYGLKLQFKQIFPDISEDECATECKERGKAYRKFLHETGTRRTSHKSCLETSVCVSTTIVSAEQSAELSAVLAAQRRCTPALCSPNEQIQKQTFQCQCQATLVGHRIHHVDPVNMHMFKTWAKEELRKQSISRASKKIQCHYLFVAAQMTQTGWLLHKAAWDPLVECKSASPGTVKKEKLCPCMTSSPNSKSAKCTASLRREVVLQVPLIESVFPIDLNKEPLEDSAASVTGSSQQPNIDLEYTQTFSNNDLDPNEVCINPTTAQFGYCSPGP
ncbi:hypothetical protein BCR37DRAFT_377726 [Protomyces lactucae-debilis]|uniref:Extracellular membrane protein CFEM domain-containing protein n=1 Tax=Protomyces lactucae-debilis TaxID=2754530 RepID=A0A1Y2FQB3_PROLT|nr:uncharacterized protein BCR37DRAFT_377726 [Protomyces lactucae-debilis]ORY84895.1 hypothetical protein BCR37DRAFT_377726 [Protomyces lactucae-debilis]